MFVHSMPSAAAAAPAIFSMTQAVPRPYVIGTHRRLACPPPKCAQKFATFKDIEGSCIDIVSLLGLHIILQHRLYRQQRRRRRRQCRFLPMVGTIRRPKKVLPHVEAHGGMRQIRHGMIHSILLIGLLLFYAAPVSDRGIQRQRRLLRRRRRQRIGRLGRGVLVVILPRRRRYRGNQPFFEAALHASGGHVAYSAGRAEEGAGCGRGGGLFLFQERIVRDVVVFGRVSRGRVLVLVDIVGCRELLFGVAPMSYRRRRSIPQLPSAPPPHRAQSSADLRRTVARTAARNHLDPLLRLARDAAPPGAFGGTRPPRLDNLHVPLRRVVLLQHPARDVAVVSAALGPSGGEIS
mmetsp:Transcript_6250/g.13758  ORF Transcript_6250/g.13758 Transcript_6250/m.13758 type:complete len:349 (-) Transcript_6250:788-1834(-)